MELNWADMFNTIARMIMMGYSKEEACIRAARIYGVEKKMLVKMLQDEQEDE